ncbi:GSCFA domain-containing protein [Aquimarina hainanensis]|uniref:GSCFA domain-containing protein n=1 Tax=Aquimarina hainanensis TaxID=1578017 RepID=A0ABW5N7L0_9FLAO
MNLQTKIQLQPQEHKIDYTSEVVLLGSCFAENIGSKFSYYKFKSLINPFGILFHPKAIETFLWMATQEEQYTESDLFQYNELWHCFDAHSKLSTANKEELLALLNDTLVTTRARLKTATHVFITLGTAWVYRLQALDMIVANCHKIPQKEFRKELLSVDEISQCIQNSIHLIRSLNNKITVTFTVSPVRHSKDGFVENSRSKSHLLTGLHQVLDNDPGIGYFPAYEIVMDELRDYRFYEMDMLHPNELAINYIWERFSYVWLSENIQQTMKRVEEIQRGMSHRAFNPDSEQHLRFLERLEEKKLQLKEQYAHITW